MEASQFKSNDNKSHTALKYLKMEEISKKYIKIIKLELVMEIN
jgi:hypothetical protein